MLNLIQLVGIPVAGDGHYPPHFLLRLVVGVGVVVFLVYILDGYVGRPRPRREDSRRPLQTGGQDSGRL